MAIVLYNKSGQIQICDSFSYLHLLDDGWFYTKEKALEAEIEEKEAEKEVLEEALKEVEKAEETEKTGVWVPNPDFGPSTEKIKKTKKLKAKPVIKQNKE